MCSARSTLTPRLLLRLFVTNKSLLYASNASPKLEVPAMTFIVIVGFQDRHIDNLRPGGQVGWILGRSRS